MKESAKLSCPNLVFLGTAGIKSAGYKFKRAWRNQLTSLNLLRTLKFKGSVVSKYVTWVFLRKPTSFFSGLVTVISRFSNLPNCVLSVDLHFLVSGVIMPYSLSVPAKDIETLLFWELLDTFKFLLTLLELLFGFVPTFLFPPLFCVVVCCVWGFTFFSFTGAAFCSVICGLGFSLFCFTGSFLTFFSGIISNIENFLTFFVSFFISCFWISGSGLGSYCWGGFGCGSGWYCWFGSGFWISGSFWGSSTSPPFNWINSLTTICNSLIDQTATSAPPSPFFSVKNSINWFTSYPFSRIVSLKKFCFSSIVASSLIFIKFLFFYYFAN